MFGRSIGAKMTCSNPTWKILVGRAKLRISKAEFVGFHLAMNCREQKLDRKPSLKPSGSIPNAKD
jgi:hypothetical protein